jgi:hypothetical protein
MTGTRRILNEPHGAERTSTGSIPNGYRAPKQSNRRSASSLISWLLITVGHGASSGHPRDGIEVPSAMRGDHDRRRNDQHEHKESAITGSLPLPTQAT